MKLILNVNQVFYLKHALDHADFSTMTDEKYNARIHAKLVERVNELHAAAVNHRENASDFIAAMLRGAACVDTLETIENSLRKPKD